MVVRRQPIATGGYSLKDRLAENYGSIFEFPVFGFKADPTSYSALNKVWKV